MGNQRKRSDLPLTPPGHPPQSPPQPPSMATASSSLAERSSAEKDTQEIYGKELEDDHKTTFKNAESLLDSDHALESGQKYYRNSNSLISSSSTTKTVVSLRPRHPPPSMTTHYQNENEASWGSWVLCPHCNLKFKKFGTEVCLPPARLNDMVSSKYAPVEIDAAEIDDHQHLSEDNLVNLEGYHKTTFKNPDSLLYSDHALELGQKYRNNSLRSSSSTKNVVSLRPRHPPPSMTTHHQNDENEANWRSWVLCPHCNQKFKKFGTELCPPPVRCIDMVSKYAWKPVEIDAAVIDYHQHLSEDNLVNLEFRSSDNRDRAFLLERISGILNHLIRTETFSDTTLITMLGFILNRVLSNDEVLERIAESDLRVFLDTPQLQHFLLYLRVLAGDCNSVLFTVNGGLLENSDFSEDESCLVLHERLLTPSAAIIQHSSVSGFYVDNAFVHTVRCFTESIKTQQYLDMLRNRDTILVSRDRGGGFLGLKSSMGQPLLTNGDFVSTNRSLMNAKDFADLLNFMCQRKGDTVLQTLLRPPPAVPRSHSAPLLGNYKDPSYPNVGFSLDLENPQERVPPRRKKPFFYRYRNAFLMASTVVLQFASTILEYETEGKSRLGKLIMTGFSVLIGLYLMWLCVRDIWRLIRRRPSPMTFSRTYLSLLTIVEPLISTAHIFLGALDFIYTYQEKELGFPFRIGSLILLCSIVSAFMRFASSRAILLRRDGRKWYKLENKIFCDGYICYELGEGEYEEELEELD